MKYITILISIIIGCHCHPQCLDFTVPFQPNDKLSFCTDYKTYSCCGAYEEQVIATEFQDIYHHFNKTGSLNQKCADFIKDILCTRCHPYAAHLFDAENPPAIEKELLGVRKSDLLFPGLCSDYCQIKFNECKDWLSYLNINPSFNEFVEGATNEEFCQWAQIIDKDYCFPKSKHYNVNTAHQSLSRNLTTVPLCVNEVANKLRNPLFAVHANDGSHRLFIVEQRGIIWIQTYNGDILPTPFLNITQQILMSVEAWDERGLLGLAFHPNYKENGRFFIFYSKSDGSVYDEEKQWWEHEVTHDGVISELTISRTDPNRADSKSEIELLKISQPEMNHNGGMLLFGKDGFLYIFSGDGGAAGDPHGKYGNGLNISTLLGKVLRIDIDVFDGRAYAIPPDNPFMTTPNARPEIYAYGIRNIWRCSIDHGSEALNQPKSGRMFCGDVGQNAEEEIDLIVKGGNYGWRAYEGHRCYDQALCDKKLAKDNLVPPIITYSHAYGKSIVGGYVYRGCQHQNLIGKYFYGDTVTGRLFLATEDMTTGKWDSKEIDLINHDRCKQKLNASIPINILSFGEDERGELYILAATPPEPDNPGGRIYRIVDPSSSLEDPIKCQLTPKIPKKIAPLQRVVNTWDPSPKENKPLCVDKRKSCKIFFKYKEYCHSIQQYTRMYCRLACGFC